MSRCFFLDLYRPGESFDPDRQPDYVQVYVDGECIKASRQDGAGPGSVHMHPDEGWDVLRHWYIPADGREHSVRLRYCRSGIAGQVAQIGLPETVMVEADPSTVIVDATPAAPARDYLDPTAVAMFSLDHAASQGRAAMDAARQADQDRRDLARMTVDSSRTYADSIVAMSQTYADRQVAFADRHLSALEKIAGDAQAMAAAQITAAHQRADAQIAAAQARVEEAAKAADPMEMFKRYKPQLDMAWRLFGGLDGIKKHAKNFLSGAIVEAVGNDEIAEAVGERFGGGLIGGARELYGMWEKATLHQKALDEMGGGGADTPADDGGAPADDDDDI